MIMTTHFTILTAHFTILTAYLTIRFAHFIVCVALKKKSCHIYDLCYSNCMIRVALFIVRVDQFKIQTVTIYNPV